MLNNMWQCYLQITLKIGYLSFSEQSLKQKYLNVKKLLHNNIKNIIGIGIKCREKEE